MSTTKDDELVRTVLRPIRGCATDNQYCDVFDRALEAITTIRQEERRAAWLDAAQKLRSKAEDWRLEGERWQQNAQSASMDIIREQDYADRDACFFKMAAAITLATGFDLEAAANETREDGDDG